MRVDIVCSLKGAEKSDEMGNRKGGGREREKSWNCHVKFTYVETL